MKLIVGLGNPGPQYQETRHNAGFMVVDRLAKAHAAGEPVKSRFNAVTVEATISGERCMLLKPLTYMNRSGQCVAEAVRFYKADIAGDLLVVVDEVYLPTGRLKLLPAGGTAGHNGLGSIQQLLGRRVPAAAGGRGHPAQRRKPPSSTKRTLCWGDHAEEQGPLDASLVRRWRCGGQGADARDEHRERRREPAKGEEAQATRDGITAARGAAGGVSQRKVPHSRHHQNQTTSTNQSITEGNDHDDRSCHEEARPHLPVRGDVPHRPVADRRPGGDHPAHQEIMQRGNAVDLMKWMSAGV
jgi:PTH1 family peptidyl-tRNA hydrolase